MNQLIQLLRSELLNIDSNQIGYATELLSMLAKKPSEHDKKEIVDTLIEVLIPSSINVDTVGYQKVGKTIRDIRISMKMTQEELAQKARIKQSHISRIETAKHKITQKTLDRIAKALNTQPESILNFKEPLPVIKWFVHYSIKNIEIDPLAKGTECFDSEREATEFAKTMQNKGLDTTIYLGKKQHETI